MPVPRMPRKPNPCPEPAEHPQLRVSLVLLLLGRAWSVHSSLQPQEDSSARLTAKACPPLPSWDDSQLHLVCFHPLVPARLDGHCSGSQLGTVLGSQREEEKGLQAAWLAETALRQQLNHHGGTQGLAVPTITSGRGLGHAQGSPTGHCSTRGQKPPQLGEEHS